MVLVAVSLTPVYLQQTDSPCLGYCNVITLQFYYICVVRFSLQCMYYLLFINTLLELYIFTVLTTILFNLWVKKTLSFPIRHYG